jgi:hypothetical protein
MSAGGEQLTPKAASSRPPKRRAAKTPRRHLPPGLGTQPPWYVRRKGTQADAPPITHHRARHGLGKQAPRLGLKGGARAGCMRSSLLRVPRAPASSKRNAL